MEHDAIKFLIFMFVIVVIVIPAIVITYRTYFGNRAFRFGYKSRAEYLQAVPRSADEKQDAIDQACKGLVVCLLGLMFPPLLLIGLFPLFYGTRKTISVCMGLGLSDESDHS
jgi:hypothetical protein